MKPRPRTRIAAVSIAVILACAGFAARATEPEQAGEHAGETQAGAFHHKQELALFVGVTDESGHDSQGTIGLEYLHRMGKRWSMGGLVDYAGGNFRNWVFAVPFAWHPAGGLKLLAAPGIEDHEGRATTDGDGHGEVDENASKFLFRLGASYDFHVSAHWRIAPAVNIDFIDGHHLWVYGANLGYAW